MSRGRPRDPEINDQILSATLAELKDSGYQGMSIDGIAARAGVSKPTIYRRWENKPALAIAAIQQLVAQEPNLEGDILEDLQRQLLASADHLEEFSSVTMLGTLLSESERHPEFLEVYREQLVEPRLQIFIGILERARAEGEIRQDVNLASVAHLLSGIVFAKYFAGTEGWEATVKDCVTVIVSGLRRS